ncbi:MAG: hypothetical protein ACERKO_04330 [Acetanaerobacterium sp.]
MNNDTENIHTASSDAPSAGTPAAAPPPMSAPPAAPPRKTRRVGTFTMGLSLVAAGSAAIYSLLNPSFDILTLLKFTPVILIFLGLEVLLFAIIGGSARLKYDFLSMLVCLTLIGCAVGISILPYVSTNWGPQRYYDESRIRGDIYNLCYAKLGNSSGIQTVDVSVDLRTITDEDVTVATLTAADHVWANVHLSGPFPSALAFAQHCRMVMDRLASTNISFDSISFRTEGEVLYTLNLDGRYEQEMTASQLEPLVYVEGMNDETYSALDEETASNLDEDTSSAADEDTASEFDEDTGIAPDEDTAPDVSQEETSSLEVTQELAA